MKKIRSSKHPGLRHAPDCAEPGIVITEVGEDLGDLLVVGERVLSVDGHTIADLLDFRFHMAFSDEALLVVKTPGGETRELRIDADRLGGESLIFEPLVFKTCGNDCVFCFIKQMPPDLREDLYLMDEDYRLGFLYGNYVTLALARDHELERIITQRLSPVYVSVHATDMPLRNRLLGLKKSRDMLDTLRLLTEGGISIHTQIVLLPGWNDGDALEKTIRDLAAFHPASAGEGGQGGVESVGVVPVGLTSHRGNLPDIKAYDAVGHARVMDQVEPWQADFLARLGSRFVFLADEFYLGADHELPAMIDYEELPLIDNGIGMGRDFVDTVLGEMESWREPDRPLRVALITAGLGKQLFERYLLERLNALSGLHIELKVLENRLFGSHITVSGLMPGREMLTALSEIDRGVDLVALPPNCLNAADLFLDDLSLAEFREKSPLPLIVPERGLLRGVSDWAAGPGD